MPLPDQEPFKLSNGPAAAACCAWPDAADSSITAADITATAKVHPPDRATDPAGADLRARRPVLNHSSIRMSSPLHLSPAKMPIGTPAQPFATITKYQPGTLPQQRDDSMTLGRVTTAQVHGPSPAIMTDAIRDRRLYIPGNSGTPQARVGPSVPVA